MKYRIDSCENNPYSIYSNEEPPSNIFRILRSLGCKTIKISKSHEEFIELCKNKYGNDVEFVIVCGLNDSDKTECINLSGASELLKNPTEIALNDKVKCAYLRPMLNGRIQDEGVIL